MRKDKNIRILYTEQKDRIFILINFEHKLIKPLLVENFVVRGKFPASFDQIIGLNKSDSHEPLSRHWLSIVKSI